MISESDQENIYDVIIIGAGLSGLMAADILLKQGKRVIVLESSSQAGGIIKNYTIGQTMKYLNKKVDWLENQEIENACIEVGASEILTSHTFMMKLVDQYDLTLVPYYCDGKFVHFESEQKISYVDSLMNLYFSEEHRITMTKLLTKIANISKNIMDAHNNMINNPSKKFYRQVLDQYFEKFDNMSVKEFLEKQIPNNRLRKLVINQFQIVESISVDSMSILQVFLHNYGLENLKLFTDKSQHFIESIRVKQGMSQLILGMEQKVQRRAKKLQIDTPIRYKQSVLEIKNEINSQVEVKTQKNVYKCYKVFFTASIAKAKNIKISKISPAKKLIFQNQDFEPVQKIFVIFQTAFWRSKFSGRGIFSEEFPFSQINDVSPSNLSCGILCFILSGKKPEQWEQKLQSFETKQEKLEAMETFLRKIIANAFLNGNMQHDDMRKMVVIPASLKDNIGYQPYTKKGVCQTLQNDSEDYLQCYSRDEHNIIFLGGELSKKFSSCMEGAIRHTREKIFKFLQISDPWNIHQ